MKNNKSIHTIFLLSMIAVSWLSLGLLGCIWIFNEYSTFNSESQLFRIEYIAEQKKIIQDEVQRTINYIHFKRGAKIKRTKHEEKIIQQEILDWINRIRFGKNGYIFVYSFDAVTLAHYKPGNIGINQWNFTDPNGVKVLQKLIQLSQDEKGGFLKYIGTIRPSTGLAAHKISFVKSIPDWEWMVGAGVYIDDIEVTLAKNQILLKKKIRSHLTNIIFLLLFFVLMIGLISKLITRRVVEELNVFSSFFRKAATDSIKILPQEVSFKEFKTLAYNANQMIDQRMEAKDRLLKSEERFRYLTEASMEAIFFFTTKGVLLDANPAAANMFGYADSSEFIDMPGINIIAPEGKKSVENQLLKNLPGSYEAIGLRKDNTQFPIAIQVKSMPYKDKGFVRVASITDITKRKQMEDELKYRSKVETAIARASNLFISSDRVDYYMVLKILGKTICANRAYIFQIQEDGLKISSTFEWCAKGTKHQIDTFQDLESGMFPWWMVKMQEKQNIIIKNIDELPLEAESEKKMLQSQQIYSLIIIPLWLKSGVLWGGMGFVDTTIRDWSDTEIDALMVVGEMISNDIETRKIRKMRKFEREQFLSIFKNFGEMIYVSDPDTYEILFVNQTMETLFSKELLGRTCYQEFHGFDSPCDFCTNDIILKNNSDPYSWECHNPILNMDLEIIDRIIKWPDGRNVRFEFARDITKRKQADNLLKESEEKYRSMMESMVESAYICSADFYIEYMNPAMIKRTGYDATGEICYKVIHGNDERCPWCASDAVMKGRSVKHEIVCPMDNKSYHVSNSPVFHTDGSISKLTVFRDVTEFKELEMRLQQSQKMESIGTLAGGIAHDFNNILFPILGHSEMLLEDIPDTDPLRINIKEIFTSALRARELVKQILTFSRLEKNEEKMMKIQSIIGEALKLIRSTIPATIEIKQNIHTDCGVIKADPTQIHQIIMNLATNAYHAMEETGGELKVSLEEVRLDKHTLIVPDMVPGVYICLTVTDTGVGIDKSIMNKIFDPFFTTKENGKGTGMGLSVVYGIVKNMGGEIQVHSQPGKGTAFYIYFPVVNVSEDQVSILKNVEYPGGTEHLLIVDDEEAILIMEKQILQRLGYRVTSHTSSIKALEVFRDSPAKFDMVITDMAMPDMPGDELSEELSRIRPDIPILLCTGFSEIMTEESAVSLGIKGFLLKPITMKDLSQKIRNVLNVLNED